MTNGSRHGSVNTTAQMISLKESLDIAPILKFPKPVTPGPTSTYNVLDNLGRVVLVLSPKEYQGLLNALRKGLVALEARDVSGVLHHYEEFKTENRVI